MSTSITQDAGTPHKPPFWRDVRVIRVLLQVGFVLAVAALIIWLYDNLVTNLSRQGIRSDFGFLDQRAGFTITGTDFRSSQSIADALVVGLQNSLRVAVVGIVVALVLGIVVGVGRLSSNWLVRRTASWYVEVLRNVPPLVLILFFYLGVITQLPTIDNAVTPLDLVVLSNRGLYVPWYELAPESGVFLGVLAVGVVLALVAGVWRTRQFDRTGQPHHRMLYGLGIIVVVGMIGWLLLDRPVSMTIPALEGRIVLGGTEVLPEYAALLIALILYTSSFIAEIVRGSIQAVPKGQTEASSSLGMSAMDRLRYVILPQAMRIATPATGNEFLNLQKNVALGVVIAYPELLRVARIAIGNGQPAPQLVAIALVGYLLISLVISAITNVANRRLQLVER
jgi:general L-amino acid transport system permease protein